MTVDVTLYDVASLPLFPPKILLILLFRPKIGSLDFIAPLILRLHALPPLLSPVCASSDGNRLLLGTRECATRSRTGVMHAWVHQKLIKSKKITTFNQYPSMSFRH